MKKARPATLDVAAKIRVAKRDLVDSSIAALISKFPELDGEINRQP